MYTLYIAVSKEGYKKIQILYTDLMFLYIIHKIRVKSLMAEFIYRLVSTQWVITKIT